MSLLDDLHHPATNLRPAERQLWMPEDPRQPTGRPLRYLLCVLLLESDRALTVPQLVDRVGTEGFIVTGRPGKTVSDALRWEVHAGRVLRVGRGRYASGLIPKSTQSRILLRVRQLRGALSLYHQRCARGDARP